MENAVIYSRYSSDKQSETSIEDQVRICKDLAVRKGWSLVGQYCDKAVSGQILVDDRGGVSALLEDAKLNKFDIVIVEGLERLSRDALESQHLVKNLEFMGIRVACVSDGYDSDMKGRTLMRGMRSIMSEIYIEDLADKTHRGMHGQVSRGYSAGAAPYGYLNVRMEGGSEIHIDLEEASIINRIFQEYASGLSPHNIAAGLNRDRVPSPRNSSWHVSAIAGNPKKGCGILHNEMYNGIHIWNRSHWVKHPVTKKRVRRERPEHEWVIEERPDLRIVPKELWDKSRERFEKSRLKGGSKGRGGKSTTLLGGLISCGKCGGSVISINANYYGCANRRDRGKEICDGVNISKKKAEEELIPAIKTILSDPSVVEYVHSQVKGILREMEAGEIYDKKDVETRLEKLDLEIKRYVEAIGKIGLSDSIVEKMKEAESNKVALEKKMAASQQKFKLPTKLEIQRVYDKALERLINVLPSNVEMARCSLSELLEDIVLKKGGLEPLPK